MKIKGQKIHPVLLYKDLLIIAEHAIETLTLILISGDKPGNSFSRQIQITVTIIPKSKSIIDRKINHWEKVKKRYEHYQASRQLP